MTLNSSQADSNQMTPHEQVVVASGAGHQAGPEFNAERGAQQDAKPTSSSQSSLAASSIRSFTLLDSKNALIFSTLSLSSEFSSQISAVPCTISTLGASFDLNIESWRTDTRACCFLRFPMVAEYSQGNFQTFPVYAFGTAEATMTFEELKQRTIVYFRVCQALLQPTEFRPPWSCHMQTLSLAPSYLMSVLCTAERLMDRNPAVLHHCFLQYPPVGIKQLELGEGIVSPCRLLFQIANEFKEPFENVPVDVCREILSKSYAFVFIDDQVFGVFSAGAITGNSVSAARFDSLDALILSVLQADARFMSGEPFHYQLGPQPDNSLLAQVKKLISDDPEDDCAVETRPQPEVSGRRILQMRIAGKLTSVVAAFEPVTMDVPLPQGYPEPRCRVCFLHPVTKTLAGVLDSNCGNQVTELVEFCRRLTQKAMEPFLQFVSSDIYMYVLNGQNPARSFCLRYQVSAYPGLLYCAIKNLSRGAVLAPNLEVDDADIRAIVQVETAERQQDVHADLEATTCQSSSEQLQRAKEEPYVRAPQGQQRHYTEPPVYKEKRAKKICPVMQLDKTDTAELIVQIQKQFQIARTQVAELLKMEHQALANGISYTIERDAQFARVIWVFYFNVTPTSELPKQPVQVSPLQMLWEQDANIFPLPLSRQQLIQLNQTEEVYQGRRTEYTEQGGYIGTPQYWGSVEKMARETKTYKKFMSQFPSNVNCSFELFEIQAVFLSLVSTDEIKSMTKTIFKKFASLVWGDYYSSK